MDSPRGWVKGTTSLQPSLTQSRSQEELLILLLYQTGGGRLEREWERLVLELAAATLTIKVFTDFISTVRA